MKINFLVLISLLLSVIGYSQPVIGWDAQKKMPVYNHSKIRKFKFKKYDFELKDTAYIDTNSVYVFRTIRNYDYKNSPDTIYHFIRFFKKGQVFVSDYFKTKPNEYECNNITYGKRGYFIIKDRILIIELFINPYDGYWLSYYKKNGNSIQCFKSEPRFLPFLTAKKEKTFNSFVPFKIKVKFNTYPNW